MDPGIDRLFPVVVRPLLEACQPSTIRHVGAEVPVPLARFCDRHAIELETRRAGGGSADVLLLDAREPQETIAAQVEALEVPPFLVVVYDAEHGLVGTPEARARAVRDVVAASLTGDVVSRIVPGLGGLVLVSPADTVQELEPVWSELEVSPRIRSLVELVDGGGPADTDGDVAAARRVIERQDREIAELRRQVRRDDALARQVERLERDLDRLKARRSVRLVLRLAEVLRPVFQLRRGELALGDLLRRPSQRWGAGGSRRRDHRVLRTHQFASTDTGRFYDIVRPVVETAPPEFIDRWAVSEEELRAQPGRVAEGDAPLVSIIMPTHNRAHLIGDAIDTVTDQTYVNWELLVCDDASEDDTESVVRGIGDDRVRYLRLPKGGAAAARNAGLEEAHGDLIAYLDTDNLWHPRFLDTLVRALERHPGRHMAYAKYVDLVITPAGAEIKKYHELPFDYERLMQKNFVDLNSLVHRRALYDRFGGFNEDLVRQQDWDLILKYAFLRDPLYVDHFLAVYRRNEAWEQITHVHAGNTATQPIIESTVASYFRDGLPTRPGSQSTARLSVLSWDICRNHFSKAYNVAEAVAAGDPGRAQLLGFRFFDEPIFPPYAGANPKFETVFQDGVAFPAFDDAFARGVASVRGDVVYAVKPRLPSLGMGLLANYHFGYPLVLETNDLESVVTSPSAGQQARTIDLSEVDPADPRLLDPYGELWTEIMEGLAPRVPLRATHNHVLDDHFGGGAFYLRNPKDEAWFDPDRYDREQVRAELGFGPDDRVLLFGGMVRKHKGVFQFAEVLERLGPRWRLLVVGSRETPDQRRLRERVGDRVRIIEPMDRNAMARVNLAADAVVLWLDPDVPASHYQMPYKLTDALAMRVPVLANPIGELADLGREGYLRLVPFGDDAELVAALEDVVTDRLATDRMVDAGRRLFLRQFSYRAVRATVDLLLDAAGRHAGPLPVAEQFAEFFARFRDAQPEGRVLPGRART